MPRLASLTEKEIGRRLGSPAGHATIRAGSAKGVLIGRRICHTGSVRSFPNVKVELDVDLDHDEWKFDG